MENKSFKTLRSFVPREFFVEFMDTPAAKMLDIQIVEEYGYGLIHKQWPGEQKHVHNWVQLRNGYAVGWNENPSKGWSFPVVKVR